MNEAVASVDVGTACVCLCCNACISQETLPHDGKRVGPRSTRTHVTNRLFDGLGPQRYGSVASSQNHQKIVYKTLGTSGSRHSNIDFRPNCVKAQATFSNLQPILSAADCCSLNLSSLTHSQTHSTHDKSGDFSFNSPPYKHLGPRGCCLPSTTPYKNPSAWVDLTLYRWQYGIPLTPNTQTCSSSTALLFSTDLREASGPSTEFFLLERLLVTGLFDTKNRWIPQVNRAASNVTNKERVLCWKSVKTIAMSKGSDKSLFVLADRHIEKKIIFSKCYQRAQRLKLLKN